MSKADDLKNKIIEGIADLCGDIDRWEDLDNLIQYIKDEEWEMFERLTKQNDARRLLISWDPRTGWNATLSKDRKVLGSSRNRKTAKESITVAMKDLQDDK